MQIELNDEVAKALANVCRKNFRTPELQILFWLTREGEQVAPAILPKPDIKMPKSKPMGRPRATWSAEARAAQGERMKRQWAQGRIGRKSKAKASRSDLDSVVAGTYDD